MTIILRCFLYRPPAVETDPATPLIQAIRWKTKSMMVMMKMMRKKKRKKSKTSMTMTKTGQTVWNWSIETKPMQSHKQNGTAQTISSNLSRSELQRFQRRQTSGVTIVSESDLLENESRAWAFWFHSTSKSLWKQITGWAHLNFHDIDSLVTYSLSSNLFVFKWILICLVKVIG